MDCHCKEIILSHRLNRDERIIICVPKFEHKTNYFYKPTPELHQFDEATVFYDDRESSVILAKDAIQEILIVLSECIDRVLKGQLKIPKLLENKIGKLYNIDNNSEKFTFQYDSSRMLCVNYVSTWIYNAEDNKICIEISPLYPWTYRDPKEGENYISFDEFISSYRPIAVIRVERNSLIKLKQKCDSVIKKLGINTDPIDPNAKRIFVATEWQE